MAETAEIEVQKDAPGKSGMRGMILGLAAMLALGGGGFFATYSGVLALPFGGDAAKTVTVAELPPVAFLPIDEMTISLGPAARADHLRFSAELEVAPAHAGDVKLLMPRVLDVLNTYLRALEERDLADPGAMTRIRAQMLRRVQIVTGEGRVRDLLITEFILT